MSNGSQLYANAFPPTIPSDADFDNLRIGDRLKVAVLSTTQITSATTAVTVNSPSVALTTFSLTNAADATVSFSMSNSYLSPLNNTQVSVAAYDGTAGGVPYVYLSSLEDGSVTVNVTNVGTVALDAPVTLHFMITAGSSNSVEQVAP